MQIAYGFNYTDSIWLWEYRNMFRKRPGKTKWLTKKARKNARRLAKKDIDLQLIEMEIAEDVAYQNMLDMADEYDGDFYMEDDWNDDDYDDYIEPEDKYQYDYAAEYDYYEYNYNYRLIW